MINKLSHESKFERMFSVLFLGLLPNEGLDVLLGLAVDEEVEGVEDGGRVGGGLLQPTRHRLLDVLQGPLDKVLHSRGENVWREVKRVLYVGSLFVCLLAKKVQKAKTIFCHLKLCLKISVTISR